MSGVRFPSAPLRFPGLHHPPGSQTGSHVNYSNSDLHDLASQLCYRLEHFHDCLVWTDGTQKLWYLDWCQSGARTAQILKTASDLTASEPTCSFILIRTALERWARLRLATTGTRYRQQAPMPKQEAYDLQRRWENGELGHMFDAFRLGPDRPASSTIVVDVVRHGLVLEGDPPVVLHPINFETEDLDPFIGLPDDQASLCALPGLHRLDNVKELATRNRSTNRFVGWKVVSESLELNHLISPEVSLRLRIHYQFLSAFSHGHQAAIELVKNRYDDGSKYDPNVVEELVLLYICEIATDLLKSLAERVNDDPTVELESPDQIQRLITLGDVRSSSLWFFNGGPTHYDIKRHQMGLASFERLSGHTAPVDTDRPGYYRNPLVRLAEIRANTRY